jgi:uncharacterized protein YecT (DUF1311 family)
MLGLFIFISISYTFAQDKHPIDKFEQECIEKNPTTAGMSNCTYEAEKKWDAEMNKYYKLLMEILDEDGKKKLKESQLAWIKFRDAEFEVIKNIYPEDASIFINIRSADAMGVVKERALQLKRYYEILKSQDE